MTTETHLVSCLFTQSSSLSRSETTGQPNIRSKSTSWHFLTSEQLRLSIPCHLICFQVNSSCAKHRDSVPVVNLFVKMTFLDQFRFLRSEDLELLAEDTKKLWVARNVLRMIKNVR